MIRKFSGRVRQARTWILGWQGPRNQSLQQYLQGQPSEESISLQVQFAGNYNNVVWWQCNTASPTQHTYKAIFFPPPTTKEPMLKQNPMRTYGIRPVANGFVLIQSTLTDGRMSDASEHVYPTLDALWRDIGDDMDVYFAPEDDAS